MKIYRLKIKRKSHPQKAHYWENFEIKGDDSMTVVSALRLIQKRPVNIDGQATSPVVWRQHCLQDHCGSCAMLINGRVQIACQTKIWDLEQPICLEPLSKFPVIRDLVVDRSAIDHHDQKLESWLPLDGYFSQEPLLSKISSQDPLAIELAKCIECGACLEACPQYNSRSSYVGAKSISQIYRLQVHPNGQMNENTQLDLLTQKGGVTDCGNAQNCVEVCPQKIPVTDALGQMKRKVMGRVFHKMIS